MVLGATFEVKRLVLAGSGHAHLGLLRALAARRLSNVQAELVTPSRYQVYSGMVPGWIAGQYALSEIRVDLLPLCQAAGVHLILDRIEGMDAERRCVARSSGAHVDYDVLSLDIGGETDLSWLQTLGDRLIPIRPFHFFLPRWEEVIQAAQEVPDFRLVVVGGGAAGAEIALAARHALAAMRVAASVDLVASEAGMLSDHTPTVAKRVRRLAARSGIRVHDERAVGAEDGVLLSNGARLSAHRVIAATGVRPACWLQLSRMSLDEEGYVVVDSAHRSVSHPDVFAAGDVCSRRDVKMERSGVHAVHAGAILAHNVIATLTGKPMRVYRPRQQSLYLLATGSLHAVASWGSWSAEGKWVWYWKRCIDRRFVRSFDVTSRVSENASAQAAEPVRAHHREGQE